MSGFIGHVTGASAGLLALNYSGISPQTIGAVGFLVGSFAPDIGNLGYFVLANIRGRGPALMPSTWRERIFEHIDAKTSWGASYKFTHSLIGVVLLTCSAFALGGLAFALGYALGHAVHLALDFFTHRRAWLLWPLCAYEGTRVPFANWWERSYTKTQITLIVGINALALLTFGSSLLYVTRLF